MGLLLFVALSLETRTACAFILILGEHDRDRYEPPSAVVFWARERGVIQAIMGNEKKQIAYDEKTIQTLDALEHIRLRTGMYIGRIGDGSNPADGIYVMLKEVIDNAVDEFIMGHGKRVIITRHGPEMLVRDYGRGIPLGKVIDCVSKINTGGKYNDDVCLLYTSPSPRDRS